jgi:hypothetical protein
MSLRDWLTDGRAKQVSDHPAAREGMWENRRISQHVSAKTAGQRESMATPSPEARKRCLGIGIGTFFDTTGAGLCPCTPISASALGCLGLLVIGQSG